MKDNAAIIAFMSAGSARRRGADEWRSLMRPSAHAADKPAVRRTQTRIARDLGNLFVLHIRMRHQQRRRVRHERRTAATHAYRQALTAQILDNLHAE